MKAKQCNEIDVPVNGDVENYVARRKRADQVFAKDFESGYKEFKAGLTQTGRSRRSRNAQPVTDR